LKDKLRQDELEMLGINFLRLNQRAVWLSL